MSETPEVIISGDEGTHLGRCGRARAEPIWELRPSHLGIAAEPRPRMGGQFWKGGRLRMGAPEQKGGRPRIEKSRLAGGGMGPGPMWLLVGS